MKNELNLFDMETLEVYEDLKTLANRQGTQASKEAAQKVLPQLKGIKKQILDLLENEPEGLTIFDICKLTGLQLQTVSGRPGELVKRNLVFMDGFRLSDSQNKATVYKHVKFSQVTDNY